MKEVIQMATPNLMFVFMLTTWNESNTNPLIATEFPASFKQI